MRLLRILALVVLGALVPLWASASQSRITEAAVYTDRAQITRTANVTVQKGEFELRFEGLPASLDDHSLQVWGTGGAQATLESVSAEMDPAPQAPEGKIGELTTKIEQLRDRKKLLTEKRKALDARIWMLISVKPEAPRPEVAQTWGNIADIDGIIGTVIAGLRAAYTEQRAIDSELRQIAREISALEKELQKIRNPSRDRTKSVLVNLTVTRPGNMEISFSYIVPGATWRPIYDIRALPDEAQVEITGYAEIVQRTGEDWTDVSLSVSTAKPQVGGTPPKVEPIYLVFYSPPPPPPAQRAPMAPPPPPSEVVDFMEAETGAAEEPGAPRPEETVATVETAQVRSAGTAVFFEVKQRKTIPSDGEPHRVPLAVDSLKAEFGHASWPEAKPYAFLRAKVVNASGHPFVTGVANVFVGQSFIGTTQIEDWAVTEERTLSLGIDQTLRVERKLVNRDEKEFGGKKTITYEYKIEIRNFKQKAVKLELYDRIPTSRQGDIQVKATGIEPEPAKKEENGILMWQINLDPGAKIEVRFSYTVHFPKDRIVVGLP